MHKEILEGRILQNIEIAKDVYRMVIENQEIANTAQCGQFVNVYPKEKHTLLPRPISICEIVRDTITLVYGVVGEGTREFASYKVGTMMRLSMAMGTGFTPYDTECAVLVGGGIGVPPLVELAKQLTCKKIAVIGFRDEPFLKAELEKAGAIVYIATDTGTEGFKGNVLELIEHENIQGDYFYSCGPKVMLKALAKYCNQKNIPIQVSLEERMGCGYGACVGCVCKIKGSDQTDWTHKKVCKDGPVFLGNEVVWDE